MYEKFTVDLYNETIKDVLGRNKKHILGTSTSSILSQIFLSNPPLINNPLELLKLSWLFSQPYILFSNLSQYFFAYEDLYIDKEKILNNKDFYKDKTIIFQIVSKGFNKKTVEYTVNSVIYWAGKIKEEYNIPINFRIWLIIDENYEKNFENLKNIIEVYAVPNHYKTKNNTKYKARALNYACELRNKLGLSNKNTFIYHQDEETSIGEDTIFGILDFIANHGILGAGIILYPLDFERKVTELEELVRSYNDLTLLSNFHRRNSLGKIFFHFHGSHFIVRASEEDFIGWDFGEVITEDAIFFSKFISDFSYENLKILKGFAYEKASKDYKDFLKQRSRWVNGIIDAILRGNLEKNHKISLSYSILNWFLALPSLIAMFISAFYPGYIPYVGFSFGLTFYTIFKWYYEGYKFNKNYLKEKISIEDIGKIILGLILEAISPYYALIYRILNRKSKGIFEVIKKD